MGNASERRLLTRRAREREREREREKKVKKRRREEKRRRCRREARTSCELPLEVHRDNSHRRSHVWRSNLLVHREEGGRCLVGEVQIRTEGCFSEQELSPGVRFC